MTTLAKIAGRLDITIGELIGDHLAMQAAKATLLTPKVCLSLLTELPDSDTKRVLTDLAESLLAKTTPTCKLPPDTELHYLTARVLMVQQDHHQAVEILRKALRLADPCWRLRILHQLCRCYRETEDEEAYGKTLEQLTENCSGMKTVADFHGWASEALRANMASSDWIELVTGLEWAIEYSQIMDVVVREGSCR